MTRLTGPLLRTWWASRITATRRLRRACAVIAFAAAVAGGLSLVRAQPDRPDTGSERATPEMTRDEASQLHREALELYGDAQYSEALTIYARILAANQGDVIALYNSACVQAKLDHPSKAAKLLVSAVMAGFIDFEKMENDPDLDSVRTEPEYQALIELKKELRVAASARLEDLARSLLGKDAIIERDDETKIVYGVELDRETYDGMKAKIAGQLRFQMESFFDGPPNSYVLVLVPTAERVSQIIGTSRIGGFYDHDTKRLVTRDLGPSLQHEITHALHHAHMDRLGQKHPMWLQEGLASIFEMYELDAEHHRMEVLDNNRLNIAINLRNIGGLTDWQDLFTLSDSKFIKSRPRARYAEARTILQFLAEHRLLERWYETYTENYEEDATGRLAFELVLDQDIDEIERDFREWLLAKAKMPEKIEDDRPALGLFIADQGANDGVEIVGIHPGGAARRAGVAPREVIIAIDGHPVFAVEEVIAEIMRRNEGDAVTLRLRRGTRYHEVRVEVRPVTPPRDFEYLQTPGVPV